MDKLNHPLEVQQFINEWQDDTKDFICAHTSGSTGRPKVIRLPKEMMRRSAERSNRHFGITKDSRLHLALSTDYIAGKMLIVRALVAGCKLTSELPSQNSLHNSVDSSPIQLLSLVGAQLPGFCNASSRKDFPKVKHLLIGGAPLTGYQRDLACSGDWTPWESYGMTETASHIALRPIKKHQQSAFQTLPGITVSHDSNDCLVIDMGEDGIFHTRDVAQLIDNTHFNILGRLDNVIITGGHKVYPEQIEAALAPHLPSGRRFIISSRRSPQWGEEIILLIEGAPFHLPDFKSLKHKSHWIPREVIFNTKFKTTSSNKIIRKREME